MTFNISLDDSFAFPSTEISKNNAVINYQNTTFILESEFNSDIINILLQNSKPKFKSELSRKKRGRPTTTNKRKIVHSSSSIDNIISKIQIHFLNFLISFINDSIKGFYGYQKFEFLNFSHKEKSKVSFDYLNEIKNSTNNSPILKINISSKYKRNKGININKNNFEQLEQNPFFKSVFNIKFLALFSKYFNNQLPLNEILIEDMKISLSPNTKSFSELLEKNMESKNDIIDLAEKFYLNNDNFIEGDDSDAEN
jgi:hypothetical protein